MEGGGGDRLLNGTLLALLLTVRTLLKRLVAELLNNLEPSAFFALVLVNWHMRLTTVEIGIPEGVLPVWSGKDAYRTLWIAIELYFFN